MGRRANKDVKIHETIAQPNSIRQRAEHLQAVAALSEKATIDTHADEALTPFCSLLREILGGNRSEIARVAKELDVSDVTVSRWMDGTAPRETYLNRLPDILGERRQDLIAAIQQTFPGALHIQEERRQTAVSKEMYRNILDLVALVEEDENRHWQIMHAIFEYALLHLDADRQGLSIAYAPFMPPQQDGYIHSLRELMVRGTYPWPSFLVNKIFLGSNTLAGNAAMRNCLLTWDSLENEVRLYVAIDNFERSACAVPVMRSGKMSGILIVSSTRAMFSHDEAVCEAVQEYARLLALALQDEDFYPLSCIHLRPMPDLPLQRAEIDRSYRNRILDCVRTTGSTMPEAEFIVAQALEHEFEEMQQQIEENAHKKQM